MQLLAAMVADIYTTAVQQGPDLPMANRSQLTTLYSSNQTLYVTRINGALDTVSHPWISTGHQHIVCHWLCVLFLGTCKCVSNLLHPAYDACMSSLVIKHYNDPHVTRGVWTISFSISETQSASSISRTHFLLNHSRNRCTICAIPFLMLRLTCRARSKQSWMLQRL